MSLNVFKATVRSLILIFFLSISATVLGQDYDTTFSDLDFVEVGADTTTTDNTEVAAEAVDTMEADSSVLQGASGQIASAQEPAAKKGLWETFIAGLVGGFLAFLMPCIFPMVPLTISYFTKKAGSKGKGVGLAIIYGISIIVIYVAFGLLITVLFGSAGLNALSSSGLFNFIFFLLLVFFAVSFFGAFEITLPSSFVNRVDKKADDSKGLGGIFFMAASLALVSFSCTGPIIGTLLVDASSKGELLAPAIGMFGFALALSLPFTLSAIFPGFLSSMPKSGGWLNSVKVCLGFLELALALKFLSAADLVWHWEWFDREVFLALWIVIFVLMGIYLLGKLKFAHDSDLPYVSVPRLFLAIISFSFATYMVPGLWGAPVSILSGLAPPMNTQDFILSSGGVGSGSNPNQTNDGFPSTIKYSDILHAPVGFHPFFELEQGLAYAKKVGKPVLIDFTGHACVNCRKMEDNIWIKPKIKSLINEEFVLIQLYVDERSVSMPKEKVHYSKILKRQTDDLGYWNLDFQATRYGSNAQPYYVLADHDLNALVAPQGAIFDEDKYAAYLQSGIDAFNAKK